VCHDVHAAEALSLSSDRSRSAREPSATASPFQPECRQVGARCRWTRLGRAMLALLSARIGAHASSKVLAPRWVRRRATAGFPRVPRPITVLLSSAVLARSGQSGTLPCAPSQGMRCGGAAAFARRKGEATPVQRGGERRGKGASWAS